MPDRIVKVVLRGEVAGFTASMNAAKASVVSTGKAMTAADKDAQRYREGLTTLGSQAGKVALVTGGALALSAKAAMDWESAWTGVTKTVNGTDAELAQLEAGLRNLAKTLPATHTEIAGVAEAAGQLGVATEDILSFTKTMIDLGETTNLTAEDAATAIAQMANVMGTSGDDIDNLGAALVALGNDGASTERQILEMAQRIAGVGAQVGLTEADVLALANAAASMGIEVEAGGSSISRVFTTIAKASKQGGAELDIFAKTAGMSSAEFARSFEAKPAQAFAAFIKGLDGVKQSGGDVFTLLDQLGLSDVRVSQALLGMAASGDLLTDSLNVGADAWRENRALLAEAEKRYGTTASEAKVAMNKIRDSMIELGDTALPVISAASSAVGDFASVLGGLPGPVKDVTGGLLGITAVTGGALWFGSKVVGGVAATRAALAALNTTAISTKFSLAGTAKGAGALAAAFAAIDFGSGILDSFSRQRSASDGMSKSYDELRTKLEETNVGKFATDFAIDLDRLTVDIAKFGEKGEYYKTVLERIGEANDGFGGKAKQLGNFLTPWIGDTEKASLVGIDLGNVVEHVSKEIGKTANETKGLTPIVDKATGAIVGFTDANKGAAEKLEALDKAALDVAGQFLGFDQTLDESTISLDTWITHLNMQATALDEFASNAVTAGRRGLEDGLIRQLEEAGPAGAMRLKELADGSEAQIKRANRAFGRGQTAAKHLREAFDGWKPLILTVQDEPAKAKIENLTDKLRDLGVGWDIPINFVQGKGPMTPLAAGMLGPAQTPADGGTILSRAYGGTVPGSAYPYGDSVLTYLAPGEEVVTNRHGEADMNRAALKAANAGAKLGIVRYAGGGTVTRLTPAAGGPGAPQGGSADLAAMAALVAAARPHVGQMTVMPHNYNEFRRQQNQHHRMASTDGVQRR